MDNDTYNEYADHLSTFLSEKIHYQYDNIGISSAQLYAWIQEFNKEMEKF